MAQTKSPAELISAYNALAGDEKTLLDLLAVAYTPLTQSDLDRALRTLKVRQPVKVLAEPLVQARLVFVESTYGNARLYCCTLPIVELVARQLARDGRFSLLAQAVEAVAPLPKSFYRAQKYDFHSADQLIRAVRIAFYRGNFALIQDYYTTLREDRFGMLKYRGLEQWREPEQVYRLICGNPFDREWFLALPVDVVNATVPALASHAVNDWRHDAALLQLLDDGCAGHLGRQVPANWHFFLGIWRLLRGEFEAAAAPMEQSCEPGALAWLELVRDGGDAGITRFEAGLAELRKLTGKRKVFYPVTLGVMFLLALWLRNRGSDARDAEAYLPLWQKLGGNALLQPCLAAVPGLMGNQAPAAQAFAVALDRLAEYWRYTPMDFLLGYLLAAWLHRGEARRHTGVALDCLELAMAGGFAWPAAELAALAAALEPSLVDIGTRAEAFAQSHGTTLLAQRFRYEAPWERALRSLANLGAAKPEAAESGRPVAEVRLGWLVYKHPRAGSPLPYTLELREQKCSGKGWAKGKAVTFKKLADLAAAGEDWLLAQDREVARYIVQDRYTNGYALGERGWLALVGHPHLQWADSGQSLELVAGQPELLVKKIKGEQVRISLEPPFGDEQDVILWVETPTRLKVAEITAEHRRIRLALGEGGIAVPLAARERVLEVLGAVSSLVTVHSDIGGAVGEGVAVAADPQPRVHLLPEGEGLRVELLVRPFGEVGPYYPPAGGGKALFVEVEGQRLHTERNFKQERKLAGALVDACPVLAGAEPYQDFAWQLEDPEFCLELLLQLQALPQSARVEWPQGESLKLAGLAGLKQFQVSVRQSRDWFAVDGQVKLDDGLVLDMQRLLELMGQGRGRFIRLDDGRFLALTDAFRKRLADLDVLAEAHGKERRIHALAAPLLEELAEEAGQFVSDQAWRERIARLRDAETLQPVLPGNLQAELRDYQIEGYNWLSRLAAWGVGACLADDMGLGKTLQALALILARAPDGPTLVIAPTSVCANWESEAVRFAPALNVQILGAGDRRTLLESLGSMDLLVCSYALLQQASVADLLTAKPWRTIVLDEAQAIKNMASKRSQSAMNLQGDFKLITTGTPVENHLGELWNLFRFINPGLLGSLESFNRRFAGPVERGDKEARQRLRRLVQPFVLRRLKSQVLEELPARTEIQLEVQLSEQERAFYEALRRQAMAELENSDAGVGEKHLQVLAAIMKLRRACCHSALVAPDLGLSSSKLALFGEVLEELLDNRHKALVFSQFVDHLSLIRAYLDDQGIAYQYLDGQTPAAERKKRVNAFQAGAGDVFLISLKAGGVGLNLTAADYVIHMDPWWNPAVEDQASDRAHRMGQQRPVTIYRLVAKDTIEEKIVALHRHKRDLADSVLAGGETSGKVGTEELLRLIREA